ncbi:MAG TPA: hypothetical protein VFQ45_16370 [Longimicrobium sp.]|nr:hypothetical protein [Longimicrobium sp.]
MKHRPGFLFPLFCALLAAAPAAAQVEAWVLPRGMLELNASALYTHYDARAGAPLGSEFLAAYTSLAGRLFGDVEDELRTGIAALFAATDDPDPSSSADSITAGIPSLTVAADLRQAPLTLRYGWSDRITLSLTVPFERQWASVLGPYLAGGTLGLNAQADYNGALLAEIDPEFESLGRSALLPTRDSPEGRELQERVRTHLGGAGDTLQLPAAPLTFAQAEADARFNEQLSPEERAGLLATSARRSYSIGDVELGARFLLSRGPAGWPEPDSVAGFALRTAVGVRARLPTGRGGTLLLMELPSGSGHAGVGVDVLADAFVNRRWTVSGAARLDVALAADVERLAFTEVQPFPTDSETVTLSRQPGARLSLVIVPRWRLTREIAFTGQYAFAGAGETTYSGGGDVITTPLESTGPWTAHSAGLGAMYSSLRGFALGETDWPFEVSLAYTRTFAGTGLAPDAGLLRVTGRLFYPTRPLPGRPVRERAPELPPATPPADPAQTPTPPPPPSNPPVTPPVTPPATPPQQPTTPPPPPPQPTTPPPPPPAS